MKTDTNNRQEEHSVHGFALVCDIVGFSLLKSRRLQFQAVKSLSDLVSEIFSRAEFKQLNPSLKDTVATGDGFIWVTKGYNEDPGLVLRVAVEIQDGVKQHNAKQNRNDKGYQVRVGVDVGEYYVDAAVFGKDNVYGIPINSATRICSAGDPGYIMVSEAVLDRAKHLDDDLVGNGVDFDWFSCGRENVKMWPMYAKHGQAFLVASVQAKAKSGDVVGCHDPPTKFAKQTFFERRVHDNLKSEAERLTNVLSTIDRKLNAERLALRLTLLTCYTTPEDKKLWVTGLRYAQNDSLFIGTSNVTFDVAENTRGQGVPGRAFRSKDIHIRTKLPKFDSNSNKKRYCHIMSEQYDIPEDHIFGWHHRRRSYIAIPIPTPLLPDGQMILSIDSDDPLAKLLEEDLRRVLQTESAKRLYNDLAANAQLYFASTQ